ncbi:hypothetical protein [Rhodoferax sp.]|uniref:hypothetical protein n=1 Tax=Rhodoferax sp. TaxID=50421 RepID=UPI00275FB863|nr:hypothetical protein [Rhodoferax sp.]
MRPSTKKPTPAPASTAPTPGKTVTALAKPTPAAKPLAPKPVAPAVPVASKTVPKPAPSVPVKPKLVKPIKAKKPKLVRDSFTIPKAEYSVLVDLKQRAAKLTKPAKKSELLRAGVKALAAMSDVAFLAALKAVPTIKTGRPAKSK